VKRKKVLLVNPWITDFAAYDFWLKPLALMYLSAWLKTSPDLEVFFIDCLDRFQTDTRKQLNRSDGRGPYYKQEIPKPEAVKDIPRKFSRYGLPIDAARKKLDSIPPPDVVLMSGVMTYWYPGIQTAAEMIRSRFGSVPIILGGIYPSLVPWHARSHSGADVVLEGPWENQLKSTLSDILGRQAVSALEEGCDVLQFSPDYQLLSNKLALPVMTSVGCPFRCSFCAGPFLHPIFRQAKPEQVIRDIKKMVSAGTLHVAFYDDALLVNKEKHLFPILRAVISAKLPVAFHTPNGLHVREIDRETAVLLKESRFQTLFLSQESTSSLFLSQSAPKVSSGDLEKALNNLERAGYERQNINIYLIIGLPGQNYEDIRQSILDVQDLGARPRLSQYSPVPGTKDWQKLCEKGRLHDHSDPLLHNKVAVQYMEGGLPQPDYDLLKLLSLRKMPAESGS
jgi:radical SAM superfamily enzyme YgiQ (UPF0313 family)